MRPFVRLSVTLVTYAKAASYWPASQLYGFGLCWTAATWRYFVRSGRVFLVVIDFGCNFGCCINLSAVYHFPTYAVQAAVLCGSANILSAEGCGCLADVRGSFAFWLRSVRFVHGLCGILAVSCGLPRLQPHKWESDISLGVPCSVGRSVGARGDFRFGWMPRTEAVNASASCCCALKIASRVIWSSVKPC